ncbi:uncharacterized protein Tco025E_02724 [Trypanosoma conorhini]|uniref:Uncharacterized protein n=1 Tax=Trypanosoma conorhini TaxID=83891 RepID=A0A3R7N1B2_9TRYP|nr:uncharacterized protein Tco025E_02724 [Trypanosoma conorhini]RNF23764.1 hypothetical protein Tco025E_02724 [Trypanosoma conorhini]
MKLAPASAGAVTLLSQTGVGRPLLLWRTARRAMDAAAPQRLHCLRYRLTRAFDWRGVVARHTFAPWEGRGGLGAYRRLIWWRCLCDTRETSVAIRVSGPRAPMLGSVPIALLFELAS